MHSSFSETSSPISFQGKQGIGIKFSRLLFKNKIFFLKTVSNSICDLKLTALVYLLQETAIWQIARKLSTKNDLCLCKYPLTVQLCSSITAISLAYQCKKRWLYLLSTYLSFLSLIFQRNIRTCKKVSHSNETQHISNSANIHFIMKSNILRWLC